MDEEFDLWKALRYIVYVLFICSVIVFVILLIRAAFGPFANQINNNLFTTSQEHTQAIAGKFSDDCTQLAQSTDPSVKKAIEADIYQNAKGIDIKKIDMPDATRVCVNTAINDVINK